MSSKETHIFLCYVFCFIIMKFVFHMWPKKKKKKKKKEEENVSSQTLLDEQGMLSNKSEWSLVACQFGKAPCQIR